VAALLLGYSGYSRHPIGRSSQVGLLHNCRETTMNVRIFFELAYRGLLTTDHKWSYRSALQKLVVHSRTARDG
jgi:hypothetical protein